MKVALFHMCSFFLSMQREGALLSERERGRERHKERERVRADREGDAGKIRVFYCKDDSAVSYQSCSLKAMLPFIYP